MQGTKGRKPVQLKYNEEGEEGGGGIGEPSRGQTMLGSETTVKSLDFKMPSSFSHPLYFFTYRCSSMQTFTELSYIFQLHLIVTNSKETIWVIHTNHLVSFYFVAQERTHKTTTNGVLEARHKRMNESLQTYHLALTNLRCMLHQQ